MPAERLIKKYPHNRRLYDTSISDYITIDDIRQMVVNEIPFKVVDKKTNEDITRNILLQIIMDQESGNGRRRTGCREHHQFHHLAPVHIGHGLRNPAACQPGRVRGGRQAVA